MDTGCQEVAQNYPPNYPPAVFVAHIPVLSLIGTPVPQLPLATHTIVRRTCLAKALDGSIICNISPTTLYGGVIEVPES